MSEEDRKVSFHHKSVAQRAAIVAAGPIANFLLAIVIFAGALHARRQAVDDRARRSHPGRSSAAAAAGFQVGDVVRKIDGREIETFSDMQRTVGTSAGQTLTIEVDRGGAPVTLRATPDLREIKDNFGNVHRIGILGISRNSAPEEASLQRVDPATATWLGVKETWFVIDRTLSYIGGVFTGREAADQVGGPIRIAQISGQVATGRPVGPDPSRGGPVGLDRPSGTCSPVPLLDGGHLLFYAVEAVRGRPLSERAQEMGFRVGLALVLMLMIFATYNDIFRIWRGS